VTLLRHRVPSLTHVFGCTSYGVIGGGKDGLPVEHEGVPALSLSLACLPGVRTRFMAAL
jgi:deleted-in-malignant-brain-tumors protein 1